MTVLSRWRLTACVCACAVWIPSIGAAQTFKIASWNIRSGHGISALVGPSSFNSNASCATQTTVPNAWGIGRPQMELQKLDGDPAVVALALQEAWDCATPARVQQVLGWAASLPDHQNGTSIVARHGFAGPAITTQLDTSRNLNPKDTAWLIEVPVCVDQACRRSVTVFVTHWNGASEAGDIQTQQTLDAMASVGKPHVLIGDLNAFDAEGGSCAPRALSTQLAMLRANAYLDAWSHLHGTAEGFTGMVNRNGCGVPNGNVFKRIDYAWSKELAPVSMARFAMAPVGADSPSDHYGILVEYQMPGDTPQPPPTEIVLYAKEAVTLVGNVQLVPDATAAGGGRVYLVDAGAPKVAAPQTQPTSYFEMTFTAAAATPYHLWIRGRARADCWCNDSVWIQISDEVDRVGRAVHRIGTPDATAYSLEECLNCGVAGWGWQDSQSGVPGGLGADIYFATNGPHTIRIQPREDGLSIDQIVLSSDRYRALPPGSSKYDRTILTR